MDGVGADRDMHRRRDPGARRPGEQADVAVRSGTRLERASPRLAEAIVVGSGLARDAIHERTGLVHHAERAGLKMGVDVLGGAPEHRQLDVVDRGRAVHGEVADDATLDQGQQARRDADLHDVATGHHDDRSLRAIGRDDTRHHLAQRPPG